MLNSFENYSLDNVFKTAWKEPYSLSLYCGRSYVHQIIYHMISEGVIAYLLIYLLLFKVSFPLIFYINHTNEIGFLFWIRLPSSSLFHHFFSLCHFFNRVYCNLWPFLMNLPKYWFMTFFCEYVLIVIDKSFFSLNFDMSILYLSSIVCLY